jgi:hypothetical protein
VFPGPAFPSLPCPPKRTTCSLAYPYPFHNRRPQLILPVIGPTANLMHNDSSTTLLCRRDIDSTHKAREGRLPRARDTPSTAWIHRKWPCAHSNSRANELLQRKNTSSVVQSRNVDTCGIFHCLCRGHIYSLILRLFVARQPIIQILTEVSFV